MGWDLVLYLYKGSVVSRLGGNAQLYKGCNHHICIKNTTSGKDANAQLMDELMNHNIWQYRLTKKSNILQSESK